VQHGNKRVFSIDRVKTEIAKGKDKLKIWATAESPDTFFKKTADKAVISCFARLIDWVEKQSQFTQEAKSEFADAADGWVIAYAKTNSLVVVTQEEFAPDAKKKVPMPNVCIAFNVEHVNSFEMLRDLGVRFGLKKRN
jgi:predicted nuclease of predicted toxin-antitoxin system